MGGTRHPQRLTDGEHFPVLGSARGDLDPGRNPVSFSICGDEEQDSSQHGLLSHLAAASVDVSSFEPTLQGVGGLREETGR